MLETTKERARGNWRSILSTLGVSASVIDGKHHPCPHCGGKDRIRFTDDNGSGGYICTRCGNRIAFHRRRSRDARSAARSAPCRVCA